MKVKIYEEQEKLPVIVLKDGQQIRDDQKEEDVDFVGGGNHMAYPGMVPDMEFWVDSTEEKTEDKLAFAVHEMIEYIYMKEKGLKYDEAHILANEYEKAFRNFYSEVQTNDQGTK